MSTVESLSKDFRLTQTEYSRARYAFVTHHLPPTSAIAYALGLVILSEAPRNKKGTVGLQRHLDKEREFRQKSSRPNLAQKPESRPPKSRPKVEKRFVDLVRVRNFYERLEKMKSRFSNDLIVLLSNGTPSAQHDKAADFGPEWITKRQKRR